MSLADIQAMKALKVAKQNGDLARSRQGHNVVTDFVNGKYISGVDSSTGLPGLTNGTGNIVMYFDMVGSEVRIPFASIATGQYVVLYNPDTKAYTNRTYTQLANSSATFGIYIDKVANELVLEVPGLSAYTKGAVTLSSSIKYYANSMKYIGSGNGKFAYTPDSYRITLRNYFTQIPAVVGKELNIYWETLFSGYNVNDLYTVLECPELASGSMYQFEECARITPVVADVGTHPATFKIYEKITGTLLKSGTFNIIVNNPLSLASPKKVMFIGDSWIENGNIQNTVKDLFGTNFQLYGTLGTTPYFHEGRGGWSTQTYWNQQSYNSKTNPFYNPSSSTFDFAYYMTNNPSFNDVQYVVIHLGINDAWWSGLVPFMNNIINNIHAFNANIKVIVCSAPLAPPANGGKAYVMSSSHGKRTVQYDGNKLMFTNFDNKQGSKTYIIPDKVNVDSVYDYPTETVAVSARNSTTITRYTDNNHLSTVGYQKVGDMHYYYLTWLFQQP